jgi:hypothetical protein
MATYNESGSGGGEFAGVSVLTSSHIYTYSVASDTANALANSDSLSSEVTASEIIAALDYIAISGDVLDVWMKNSLSAGDKTNLDNVVSAHTGVAPTPPVENVNLANVAETSDNFLRVVEEPREGDAVNFYSPNMADRTTWYEGSTEVDDFELTDSGDLTTWNTNGTHPGPWVDLYHGKLFKEDDVLTATPAYAIKVEVDAGGVGTWVEKTQNYFGDTATGDYNINYDNGTVTFNSALTSGDKVRASFCKAPSSMTWTAAPDAGKRLKLMYAEAQFTDDIEMLADIVYETWAYNPYDLPNKIKIGEIKYKTISDFLYETTGAYPRITGFGGTGLRGLNNKDVIIFPFNYSTARDIKASQGVEVRITTSKVHTGTMMTSTLYCLQEDE